MTLNNLGDVAVSQQDFSKAGRYYLKALALLEELQAYTWALEVVTGTAQLMVKLGAVDDVIFRPKM